MIVYNLIEKGKVLESNEKAQTIKSINKGPVQDII